MNEDIYASKLGNLDGKDKFLETNYQNRLKKN